MLALIGKKIGMTSFFDENGKNIPCTVVQAGPCDVLQLKTEPTDGYNAVQIGYGNLKKKHTNTALAGHFKKSGVTPKKKILEIRNPESEYKLGDQITIKDLQEGDYVDVVGTSKGKGFQGVVKRHGFSGVGDATHGQHNRLRAPGSIGAGSDPSRVFKGTKMAGRMGGERVTVQNLKIMRLIEDENIVILKGAVPGHRNGYVTLYK